MIIKSFGELEPSIKNNVTFESLCW